MKLMVKWMCGLVLLLSAVTLNAQNTVEVVMPVSKQTAMDSVVSVFTREGLVVANVNQAGIVTTTPVALYPGKADVSTATYTVNVVGSDTVKVILSGTVSVQTAFMPNIPPQIVPVTANSKDAPGKAWKQLVRLSALLSGRDVK